MHELISQFNTIVPHRLADKMRLVEINTHMCCWVLSVLTDCPKVAKVWEA